MTSVSVHSRKVTRRHYLMCRPEHFDVSYVINPWMDPAKPVDTRTALLQWESLYSLYRSLGHRVDLVNPVPGLPDMVFSANGATVVDGKVLGAKFLNEERAAEAPAHRAWYRANGFTEIHDPHHVNEGEGDFAVTESWILAGRGFRCTPEGHQEAQEFFGRPVISLELVDPRFYHLDTALCVLDGDEIMYYPQAFTLGSREVLARLFPDALLVDQEDADVLGLNAVSDGLNVVLPEAAQKLAGQLRARGFRTHGTDLSELLKGGGSVKCCTQELRF
ncbi:dimethylargininase [Streptomyces sp. NPDC060209]|uniref:dimethylargininase n=1 Tax=Streptomyces sp. NPDC060209 TaxID=3347073 RepID=UPI0036467F68